MSYGNIIIFNILVHQQSRTPVISGPLEIETLCISVRIRLTCGPRRHSSHGSPRHVSTSYIYISAIVPGMRGHRVKMYEKIITRQGSNTLLIGDGGGFAASNTFFTRGTRATP